ncbi:MAG: hypothetical protein JXA13_00290 [Anaerolineales bacterium]|nr:hypothetical protein [Anaerolineales bacterium]
MIKLSRFLMVTLALIVVLSSCNLPSTAPSDPNTLATAAAQTVEAQLTAFAPVATATSPGTAPTSTGIVPPTLPPTFTSVAPQPTATQNCDKASLSSETYPDGSKLSPDESFTKTWRLKNTGTCSWTSSYQMVFVSGDAMGGPAAVSLTGNVNPGQEIDVPVSLKAPASSGTYKGTWKLRNAAGVYFATVWVEIKVETAAFAVTSVNYTLTTWDGTYTNCPKVIASITTNGPGDVTFKWKRMDSPNGGSLETITFNSAGTKNVEYEWQRGNTWKGTDTWVGIYIDDPNHQDFGHLEFDEACDP